MIKLFITDIDGCLMEPFKTPSWKVLGEIKKLNEESRHDDSIPPLTICTGRPMPYAEAVAQWMGVELPIVFESAGVFHLEDYTVTVNGVFDERAKQEVQELKKWLQDEIIAEHSGMQAEFAKLMDAGLVHTEEKVIQQALPKVQDYVREHYNNFEVHNTDVSINIIRKGNNKRNGIEKLCEMQGIDVAEAAYIGDSSGDIPGLELVGRAFAPANASAEVKSISTVMDENSSEAVLRAYQAIIEANKA